MKRVLQFLLRFLRLLAFVGYYFYELVKSSLFIAWDIITPGDTTRPGIVEVELDLKTDIGLISLANLISMTPGSLTIEMTPDKKKLYVHVMYLEENEDFSEKLKNELEKKIMLIFE
jgi:multicomponent Na+:H+ antiporter subunit E